MNAKIEHQKYVADTVLSKLELLDRYCIVAGGAPRDWYLGNEATDIDVYLYCPLEKRHVNVKNLLEALDLKISDSFESWKIPLMYEGNKCVDSMYNCIVDNKKVQVIFMTKPTFISVVDTFPISISKVWYKNGNIKTTEDFKNSIRYKILWKTVEAYSEDNRYLTKIKEKFGNYKYVTKKQAASYEKLEQIRQLFSEVSSLIPKEEVKNWFSSL